MLRGGEFKLLSFSGFYALISFIYVINILPHEGQFQQTSTKKFFLKYEFVSTNGIVLLSSNTDMGLFMVLPKWLVFCSN